MTPPGRNSVTAVTCNTWRDKLTTIEILLRMLLIAVMTLAVPPVGRWLGKALSIELKLNYRQKPKASENYTPTLRSAAMVTGLGGMYDQEPTVVERAQ